MDSNTKLIISDTRDAMIEADDELRDVYTTYIAVLTARNSTTEFMSQFR